MRYVEIRSEAFSADAIHWSELPATNILNFISAPEPTKAFMQARRILKLALSPADAERFAGLTLEQAIEVMDQYLLNEPKERSLESVWKDQ